MRKGEVMRPFRAPRSKAGKTAAQASPTRQSPRRTGKPDTTGDSEGPTELRVTRWVIPETQAVGDDDVGGNTLGEDNTDNKSDTQTERDDVGGNAEPWTIEARHKASGKGSLLNASSPSVSEFEQYLEEQVSQQEQNRIEGRSRKSQSNDEFWEGVLQSELKRVSELDQEKSVLTDKRVSLQIKSGLVKFTTLAKCL
jgi:hypothetical protein